MKSINQVELSTDESYFYVKHHMSCSSFKRFSKCEVEALSEWGEPSVAMKVGSYVDAFVSGTLDKFKELNPDIVSSRGSTKGELKAEYKQADLICDYIMKDRVISQFLSGEKQVVMTGEIEGVPTKIKMDSYSKGIAISDLKVMATVTDKNGSYINFISPYGYDIQCAIYQEICFQNTGERLPCYIVAVTKESPINSVVVQIPQEVLDRALYQVKSTIVDYYAVKMGNKEADGCGKCKACIERREDTPLISMNLFLNQ
jgi:hypothetical protein